MSRRSWGVVALAGLLIVAAACGDDDDERTDANGAPDATATATETATANAAETATANATETASATTDGTNGTPVASFTAEPSCTTSGSTEITFASTSTDPDGDELSHSWVLSSGSPGSAMGPVVSGVTFPNIAPYPIKLTVDDGRGGTDSTMMDMGPC